MMLSSSSGPFCGTTHGSTAGEQKDEADRIRSEDDSTLQMHLWSRKRLRPNLDSPTAEKNEKKINNPNNQDSKTERKTTEWSSMNFRVIFIAMLFVRQTTFTRSTALQEWLSTESNNPTLYFNRKIQKKNCSCFEQHKIHRIIILKELMEQF